MSFDRIIGQNRAVSLLRKYIESGQVAGAYLFVGKEGVGKQLTAKVFAQALNCAQDGSDPCGRCNACLKIGSLSHPDVGWLSPAGASRSITIDAVRKLQRSISLKPMEGRMKVQVIVDAESMTPEASNSLLKVLEEPPESSVLILITSNLASLFPTVVSRCQLIRFSSLGRDDIEKILVDSFKVGGEEARLLSRLADGEMRRALELRGEEVREEREEILDLTLGIALSRLGTDALRGAEDLMEMLSCFSQRIRKEVEGRDEGSLSGSKEDKARKEAIVKGEYRRKVYQILDVMLSLYRDVLILKGGGSEEILINVDYRNSMEEKLEKFSKPYLEKAVRTVEETRGYVDRNANLQLALENMLLSLRGGSR